jgi:hypothetical protein
MGEVYIPACVLDIDTVARGRVYDSEEISRLSCPNVLEQHDVQRSGAVLW